MVGSVNLIIFFINKINFILVFFSKLLTPKKRLYSKYFQNRKKHDIINIQEENRISLIIYEEV